MVRVRDVLVDTSTILMSGLMDQFGLGNVALCFILVSWLDAIINCQVASERVSLAVVERGGYFTCSGNLNIPSHGRSADGRYRRPENGENPRR
jgi:hypothetical protein